MDFLTLARKRQSIRGFLPTPVTEAQIQTLLQAAIAAPSGGNRQPWHFYVITNRALIDEIVENACRQQFLKTAPVLITVCAEPGRSGASYSERCETLYCIQDTAAAVQNILLAATEIGLGTCWCGAFDEQALAKTLSLPEGQRPVALIPVGYFEKTPPARPRRPLDEVVTFLK